MTQSVLKNHYTAGLAYAEGYYYWTTDLECVSHHMEDLFDFPTFDNTFSGPTLFLLGESGYVTYVHKKS